MNRKFSKIIGVAVTLSLLSSLILGTVPVSAGTVTWSAESGTPSSSNQVLEEINILDIGVGGDGTIYAGSGENLIYKSTDRGVTWGTTVTTGDTDLVAVAPDDDSIVAYADTATDTVYVSTNGASTFTSLGVASETGGTEVEVINDLAISPDSSGTHYVAIAGTEVATPSGANVYHYNLGATVPAWKETNDKDGFNIATDASAGTANTAAAIAFSPNFASDQIMVALIFDTAAAEITLEMYSFNQAEWNTAAGFSSWKVEIEDDDGITGIDSAAIAIAPDYLGSDDTQRLTYVSLTVDGDTDAIATSGLYRVDNTSVKALKVGSSYKAHSVDYDGTTLVVGQYDSNVVRYSANATATSPTISTTRTLKRPGMSNNTLTVVALTDGAVVAGTSGDSSAFAVSVNNGVSFNDISLIDTPSATLNDIEDVAVSDDAGSLYLVTDDADGMSLWRKVSAWERVLAVPDVSNFIVRLAPDDSDVVYVADTGTKLVYYSADGGADKWQTRSSRYNIADLAVEGDGDIAYIANSANDEVSKTTNTGFTWGGDVDTGMGALMYSIKSLGTDLLLVTNTSDNVAYSTDGNSSWTKVAKDIAGDDGDDAIATASGLADGDYIYAATEDVTEGESHIFRWQIGTSTTWKELTDDGDIPASHVAHGIVLSGGVLYVTTASGSSTETFRTLNPTAALTVTWTTITDAIDLDREPQGLKVSNGDSPKLWAIDNDSPDVLVSYTDALANTGPTLASPADGTSVTVNPITGYTQDVTFKWEKPSSNSSAYDLKIYDADDSNVFSVTLTATGDDITQVVGKDISGASFTFMPDQTYTWKVRVSTAGGDTYYSPYSAERSFTIGEAVSTLFAPELKAPAYGAEGTGARPVFAWAAVPAAVTYELELADNPFFTSAEIKKPLKHTVYQWDLDLSLDSTYYWRVKAVSGSGESSWSESVFSTVGPPAPPEEVLYYSPVSGLPFKSIEALAAHHEAIEAARAAAAAEAAITGAKSSAVETAKLAIPPIPPVAPMVPTTPVYIWVIIGVGAVLVIAVIVLIVTTRQRGI